MTEQPSSLENEKRLCIDTAIKAMHDFGYADEDINEVENLNREKIVEILKFTEAALKNIDENFAAIIKQSIDVGSFAGTETINHLKKDFRNLQTSLQNLIKVADIKGS